MKIVDNASESQNIGRHLWCEFCDWTFGCIRHNNIKETMRWTMYCLQGTDTKDIGSACRVPSMDTCWSSDKHKDMWILKQNKISKAIDIQVQNQWCN